MTKQAKKTTKKGTHIKKKNKLKKTKKGLKKTKKRIHIKEKKRLKKRKQNNCVNNSLSKDIVSNLESLQLTKNDNKIDLTTTLWIIHWERIGVIPSRAIINEMSKKYNINSNLVLQHFNIL